MKTLTQLSKEELEEFNHCLMTMKYKYSSDDIPNAPAVSWDFIEKDFKALVERLLHDTEQAAREEGHRNEAYANGKVEARAKAIEILERIKSLCLMNEANGKTGKPSDVINVALSEFNNLKQEFLK